MTERPRGNAGSPDPESSLRAAWDELTAALDEVPPTQRPEFNPPVNNQDLAVLGDALAPRPVPIELRTLLELADGQASYGPGWGWDFFGGRFLSARRIAYLYQRTEAQRDELGWSRAWATITRESWNSASIELVHGRTPMLIDTTMPGPPSPLAPSLTAAITGVTGLVEAGLVGRHEDEWHAQNPGESQREFTAALLWLREYYQQVGWGDAPFRQQGGTPPLRDNRIDGEWLRREWISPQSWPEEWRGER